MIGAISWWLMEPNTEYDQEVRWSKSFAKTTVIPVPGDSVHGKGCAQGGGRYF